MPFVPNIISHILYPAAYACLVPILFLGALTLIALQTHRLSNLWRASAGVLVGVVIGVALALIDQSTIHLAGQTLDIQDLAVISLAGIFGGYAGFLSLTLVDNLIRKKQEVFAISVIIATFVILFYFLFFAGNMQGFMTVFVFFFTIGLIVRFKSNNQSVPTRAK